MLGPKVSQQNILNRICLHHHLPDDCSCVSKHLNASKIKMQSDFFFSFFLKRFETNKLGYAKSR